MITALMVLVCAVVVLGWVLAGIAFVASVVSMVPRLVDSLGTPSDDRALPAGQWQAGDRKFLHDLGIRP